MTAYLTKVGRRQLAKKVAIAVFGQKATSVDTRNAGEIIDDLVDTYPQRFITFHETYCSPKRDVIISAAIEKLTPQQTLF